MNIKTIIDVVLSGLLPAIWVAAGPVLTAGVTAWINSIVGAYVPRPVQVILSGLLGSITAALTASAQGIDPGTAAGIGLSMGLGAQTFAALQPKTLLTSAPGVK